MNRLLFLFAVVLVGGCSNQNNLADKDFVAARVVVEKEAERLTLFSDSGEMLSFPISLGGQPEGHKQCQGDQRTPEGKYFLDWKNPNSCCYLSLHISYPNEQDKKNAVQLGCDPGGNIMIHGITNGLGWIGRLHRLYNWTDGCIAVTNGEMQQIYDAVGPGTPIEIKP